MESATDDESTICPACDDDAERFVPDVDIKGVVFPSFGAPVDTVDGDGDRDGECDEDRDGDDRDGDEECKEVKEDEGKEDCEEVEDGDSGKDDKEAGEEDEEEAGDSEKGSEDGDFVEGGVTRNVGADNELMEPSCEAKSEGEPDEEGEETDEVRERSD